MNEEYKKILSAFKLHLEQKNYKKRGIENALRNASFFFDYLQENNLSLASFSFKDACSYRESLVLARNSENAQRYNCATINVIISNLRLLFKYLVSLNLTLSNVFNELENMKEAVRLPKNILTIEQTKKLLESIEVNNFAEFKFKVVIEVLYASACRISEVEKLSKKDIDLERGVIKITDDKERKDRIAPLTEYARELLRIYLTWFKDEDKVFSCGQERSLNHFVNDRLKKITKQNNLPCMSCHSIRHSVASQMLKKGADLRDIQEILGHKRIKNTEVYTRLAYQDLKKIIEEKHPRERE